MWAHCRRLPSSVVVVVVVVIIIIIIAGQEAFEPVRVGRTPSRKQMRGKRGGLSVVNAAEAEDESVMVREQRQRKSRRVEY
jgi:hypothetical protein